VWSWLFPGQFHTKFVFFTHKTTKGKTMHNMNSRVEDITRKIVFDGLMDFFVNPLELSRTFRLRRRLIWAICLFTEVDDPVAPALRSRMRCLLQPDPDLFNAPAGTIEDLYYLFFLMGVPQSENMAEPTRAALRGSPLTVIRLVMLGREESITDKKIELSDEGMESVLELTLGKSVPNEDLQDILRFASAWEQVPKDSKTYDLIHSARRFIKDPTILAILEKNTWK
jgi:hypothetical protein